MDTFLEIIVGLFEFIFDDSLESASDDPIDPRPIQKIIRLIWYPLIAVIVLLCVGASGLMFILGTSMLNENRFASIALLAVALTLLIGSIWKCRRLYLASKMKH